jgi:hypothetical protein
MERPEPVPGQIDEVTPGVAFHFRARRPLVAELNCDQRLSPATDPRKPLRVALEQRPQLVQPPLSPSDREQLRELEDVGRKLTQAKSPDLERLAGQPLRVGEAAVERGPDSSEAHGMPRVERLPDQLRDRRHRLDLRVHGPPSTELQEAVKAGVVSQELGLRVSGLARHPKHLLGMGEALEHELGRGERPVARVESGDECLPSRRDAAPSRLPPR